MKKIVALSLFIVVSLVLSDDASAQKFTKRKRYFSFGWSIGACNYVGDLDPGESFYNPAFSKTGLHLGLFGGMFRWKPRVSFRGALAYNMIRGNDAVSDGDGNDVFRKARNLNFVNHMAELKVDMIYDLFANKGTYLKRPDYTPYAFIGLAIFYQTPYTTDAAGNMINLRTYNNGNNSEGVQSSPVQIAVPFGLGIRKKMNKEWDFAFEMGWRMTFSDYLDDVSNKYTDMSSNKAVRALQTRSHGPEMMAFALKNGLGTIYDPVLGTDVINGWGNNATGLDKRGTSTYNDWYIVTNIQITKVMKGGVRCPKFR